MALEIIVKGIDQASSVLNKVGDAISGLAGLAGGALTAGLGAATAGLAALGAGLAYGVSQAIDAENAMAQTEAVIKSTGGAAGLTADAIADLASELSKTSTFADDAIQQGENLLLTFTNIGKDVFPQATQALVDMAAAMGTDVKSGAIQLGKALNDPIAGIAALSRVGVTFTNEQKKVIEQMVKTGDVAGAQKVILAELNKEFGGSAAAAADTFGGKMQQLQNRLDGVAETIGGAVLPILGDLIGNYIEPLIPAAEKLAVVFADMISGDFGVAIDDLREGFGGALDGAIPVIKAIGDLSSGIAGVVGGIMGFVAEIQRGTPLLVALHSALGDLFPADLVLLIWDIQDAFAALLANDPDTFFSKLSDVGDGLSGIFGDIAANIGTWMNQIIPPVIAWIQEQIPIWVQNLQSWGKAFVDWVSPQIPPLIDTLQDLIAYGLNWVRVMTPIWVENLKSWGESLIAWIGPQIPPMLVALGDFANNLLGWIGEQVPVLIANLYAWGTELINWIAPQVEPMLAELGSFLGAMTAWIITTGIPELQLKMGEMAIELYRWITDVAIPQIGPELIKFKTAMDTFFTETLLPSLVKFGTNFVDSLLEGMGVKMPDDLVKAFSDALKAIGAKFTEVRDSIVGLGKSIVQAMIDGVVDAAGGLAAAAVKAVQDALAAAGGAITGTGATAGGSVGGGAGGNRNAEFGGGAGGGSGGGSTTNNTLVINTPVAPSVPYEFQQARASAGAW